jgi:4'-phosphopantetheinyl transferase
MLTADKVPESGRRPEPWTDRRSPDRPQFVEGWRKAVRRKLAQSRTAPPIQVAPTGHIEIWIASPDHLMRAQSSLALLSADDWVQINRNQDPSRRRAAAAARVILRIALSAAVDHKVRPGDWRFVTAASGKPAVAADLPQIHFSVSHLDPIIVVAVSAEREVGIDIECVDQNVGADLIAQFAHVDEQHSIGGLPRPREIREFIRLWTLKEAYTKLTGAGHMLDFRSMKFTLDPVNLESEHDDESGSTQFENFYISNKHLLYFASLAIRHPPHDAGTTEVQIVSLARAESGSGESAMPLER